jgi:hypothetical protein
VKEDDVLVFAYAMVISVFCFFGNLVVLDHSFLVGSNMFLSRCRDVYLASPKKQVTDLRSSEKASIKVVLASQGILDGQLDCQVNISPGVVMLS